MSNNKKKNNVKDKSFVTKNSQGGKNNNKQNTNKQNVSKQNSKKPNTNKQNNNKENVNKFNDKLKIRELSNVINNRLNTNKINLRNLSYKINDRLNTNKLNSDKLDNYKLNSNKLSNNNPNEKKTIKINKGDIYQNSNLNIDKERSQYNSRPNATIDNVKKAEPKEIPPSEIIDKMLSIGKTFFVNGTIFVAATTILIGGFVYFTGYDVVPIIEKHFIYTSKEEDTSELAITKLHSIDLSKNLPSEDVFTKLYDFVSVDIGEIILDEELFNSGRESFNSKISGLSSEKYSAEMLSDSAFYSALESIYSSNNRYPYSVTLTSIGSVTRGSKVFTKLSVDINAVDDDLGFHVWNLAVFLNNDNKIEDVKILAENRSLTNTRTPLDPSLSVITNGVNDNLSRSVNTFLKGLTNESLYNKLIAGNKPFNKSQLKAFFSKLNIEDINYDVLSEMFEISKGNGSNFAVTEVLSTDFDGEPITDVILSIKSGEDTYMYDLQYNRREKALVSISKV